MITGSWRTCTTRTSFVSAVRTMFLELGPSRTPLPCSFPKTLLPMASNAAVTCTCCRQTAGPLWLVMTDGLLPRSSTNATLMRDNNGTFACCVVGCYNDYCACPTKQGIDMTPISYYPRYSAINPRQSGRNHHTELSFFYGVYQNDARPESLSVRSSFPTYGRQEGAAGDELGHLAGMSHGRQTRWTGVSREEGRQRICASHRLLLEPICTSLPTCTWLTGALQMRRSQPRFRPCSVSEL